jgi:hypothetical protein
VRWVTVAVAALVVAAPTLVGGGSAGVRGRAKGPGGRDGLLAP